MELAVCRRMVDVDCCIWFRACAESQDFRDDEFGMSVQGCLQGCDACFKFFYSAFESCLHSLNNVLHVSFACSGAAHRGIK